jgi:hypothetical protein
MFLTEANKSQYFIELCCCLSFRSFRSPGSYNANLAKEECGSGAAISTKSFLDDLYALFSNTAASKWSNRKYHVRAATNAAFLEEHHKAVKK